MSGKPSSGFDLGGAARKRGRGEVAGAGAAKLAAGVDSVRMTVDTTTSDRDAARKAVVGLGARSMQRAMAGFLRALADGDPEALSVVERYHEDAPPAGR